MTIYIKLNGKSAQLGGTIPLDDTWIPYDGPIPEEGIAFDLVDDVLVESKYSIQYRKEEAKRIRNRVKHTGVPYGEDGPLISLTAEDGNGLLQVKAAFELGVKQTTIHFSNGTRLPMTAEEFPQFALWFIEQRNAFFGE